MKLLSPNLAAFHAVARTQSFSKAAKELHITQPALSQRILNLEGELKTRLFMRDTTGVRITEGGSHLLRYCQTQLALENEVLQKIASPSSKSEPAGTLRIAGFSTVMRSVVLPRLGEVVRSNPEVKIEASVRELGELPKLLRSGEADYVVLDHALDDAGIETLEIGHEENVLIESIRKGARKDIYLDHDPEDKTTQRFLELQNKGRRTELKRSYLDDIYGIIDGVAMGWGRAVVPLHLIENRKDVRVVSGFRPLKASWVLHYYAQPYSSGLHQVVLSRLLGSPAGA